MAESSSTTVDLHACHREVLTDVFQVSGQTISNWKHAGMPTAGTDGKADLYDLPTCVQWRVRQLQDKARADRATYDAERTRLTRAQARKTELQADKLQADVIEVETVVRVLSEVMGVFKAEVMAVPSRVREVLPDMPISQYEELDVRMRRVLEDAHKRLIDRDWSEVE